MKKCPECRSSNIQEFDINNALCSWVERESFNKAIFYANGFHIDASVLYLPLALSYYYEEELVNFDGDFKQIISYLKNKSKDRDFEIVPNIY